MNHKKKQNTKSSQQPILQDTSNIYSESEPSNRSRKKIETKDTRKHNNAPKHPKEDESSDVKGRGEEKRRKPVKKHKKPDVSENPVSDTTNKNELS